MTCNSPYDSRCILTKQFTSTKRWTKKRTNRLPYWCVFFRCYRCISVTSTLTLWRLVFSCPVLPCTVLFCSVLFCYTLLLSWTSLHWTFYAALSEATASYYSLCPLILRLSVPLTIPLVLTKFSSSFPLILYPFLSYSNSHPPFSFPLLYFHAVIPSRSPSLPPSLSLFPSLTLSFSPFLPFSLHCIYSSLPQNPADARKLLLQVTNGDRMQMSQLKQAVGHALKPLCGIYDGYYRLNLGLESSQICLRRLMEVSETLRLEESIQWIFWCIKGGFIRRKGVDMQVEVEICKLK